ncbi:Isoleucine--tRNA ligase, cytoplasmic [Tolypocladium ophioglossoides CBS 100239]|uniref:isoleucine--tRNA ligase n=1 Tax=Tolypocladium ophioglossoides (strain CBS 100239) TaxID=1163406 RepID=A0A0L0NDE2_TOLOC|nr:Isoleucine--tRNA ligase, cytoplasmic [Tolypocladium ophioglossoides CBS 100239]
MSVDFPRPEEGTLQYWREIDAFKTQLRLTEDGPRFSFYDGPPFAVARCCSRKSSSDSMSGLPHYGHLLTSTIKDIIPRYWTMKGYHVVRRFGWDTHGVPIEYQIDQKLGISGRDAVLKMGIEKYNEECKAIVMTYATEWKQIIERVGRWVDMENDYKTMDKNFMESVWWVFKQLFDKDQVYRAYQIMPYSTALCTPLSHMESKQNEHLTQDPAVLVACPLVGVEGRGSTSLVIYTTTPWTLPSNLFIAAHPRFEYLEILDETSGKRYVMMESGLAMLYKDPKKAKYKVLGKLKGKEMVGWKYEPLFKYFVEAFGDCFQVILADYVEEGEGTGLVHQAPAFGQEDYDAAVAAGFIGPERLPPCPVDEKGCFTADVSDYVGQHVKVADKAILRDLRPTGRLLVESQIMHSDKFCWRSDTQLIRKAVSSWFVKVDNSIPEMMQNLEDTAWTPSFVKDKRFANWITGAHDWNVSRNRYWGTPLPLWASDDYEEIVCVGSIEELKRMSGYTGEINDIHRDKIDHITIPSKCGKGELHRIEEIFDCWFESGSMPYASVHYPFENADHFHGGHFPADFIAEGLDQTRGWFYSLTVLGNKLFGKSPFRNVLVNGMVLAEDGKKMSKSLKNFPDPHYVLDTYGSNALRLYLISSPVVRAEPLRFKEPGVKEVVSKVLLPLWHSYRFFSEQAGLYKKSTGDDFVADPSSAAGALSNVMDRWILADCQSLLKFMEQEMLGYRLYTVVPRLLRMIDDLTNWYIRFNRKRLKGAAGLGVEDTSAALNTLLQVLFTIVRALAPFTPFITEYIYGLLKPHLGDIMKSFRNTRSVHFLAFPTADEAFFDEVIERKMAFMQKVIQLGRVARERRSISLKTPLLSLVVVTEEQHVSDLESLKAYVQEELNVRDVILTTDAERYGVLLEAKVDWPTLGKKLKKDVQIVRKALPTLTQEQLRSYLVEKKMAIGDIELEENDLAIVRVLHKEATTANEGEDGPRWEPAFADEVLVLLDMAPHPELVEEGLAREMINRVQRLRKKAGLVPADDVRMQYAVVSNPDGVEVGSLVLSREDLFRAALRRQLEGFDTEDEMPREAIILQEECEVGALTLRLRLLKA